MILRWRGQGGDGRHVRDIVLREHVCWSASRGAWHASVYLRVDGRWSWESGRVDYIAIDDFGERSGEYREHARGLSGTRRRAQRAARKAMARLMVERRALGGLTVDEVPKEEQ